MLRAALMEAATLRRQLADHSIESKFVPSSTAPPRAASHARQGLFARIGAHVQRLIVGFLETDEACDMGKVSRGGQSLCEAYFASLGAVQGPVTAQVVTHVLRHCRTMRILDWSVSLSASQRGKLRTLLSLPDERDPVEHLVRRNAGTLQRVSGLAGNGGAHLQELLGQCSALQEVPREASATPLSELQGPLHLERRLNEGLLQLVRSCASVQRLALVLKPQGGAASRFLPKLLSERPLQSLELVHCSARHIEAAARGKQLSALTELRLVLAETRPEHQREFVLGLAALLGRVKSTLTALSLLGGAPESDVTDFVLWDLPALQSFRCALPLLGLHLAAPALEALSTRPDVTERLLPQPQFREASRFPCLRALRFAGAGFSWRSQYWQLHSLREIVLPCIRSVLPDLLERLLAELGGLETLVLTEAAPENVQGLTLEASIAKLVANSVCNHLAIKGWAMFEARRRVEHKSLRRLQCLDGGIGPVLHGAHLPALRSAHVCDGEGVVTALLLAAPGLQELEIEAAGGVSQSNEGLLSLLRLIAKHADFARALRRVVFPASPAALRKSYSAHAEREFAKQLHRHGILGPARRLPSLCEVALRDAPPVLCHVAAAAGNSGDDEFDSPTRPWLAHMRAFRWDADLQEVLAPQPPRRLLL